MLTTVTLANAARWNLDKAATCRKERDAERYRANARRCMQRLKELA